MSIKFPKDFTWGCATASYQIEGAASEDGKGPSIWDVFSHEQGHIENNDTGDIACDHYNLNKSDVKLMREMGLKSYRFSISWPRIYPDASGRVNKKGLRFYEDLGTSLSPMASNLL
jgi:beta-glucosidase